MDLSFTDAQLAVTDLARSIFRGEVTDVRIAAAERSATTTDHELLATLAASGLLGVGLPDAFGGADGGTVELCCLLEQHGRSVAPLPLAPSLAAAAVLASHAAPDVAARWIPGITDGSTVLATAVDPAARPSRVAATDTGAGWSLTGTVPAVRAAPVAAGLLIAARADGDGERLFLVDPTVVTAGSVRIEAVRTTDRLLHGHVTLEAAAATAIGGDGRALAHLRSMLQVALAATALGVAEEAVERAAAYTSQRHQFGQPLSSFQSTAHRAADCYIDVAAMRATLWQAAWLLDQPGDPDAAGAALVAAWWAADAGARIVQAVQHLHGGLGADLDYPIHRFFLWGSQLAVDLGGASTLLDQLGLAIADRADPTDPSRSRDPRLPAPTR